MSDDDTPIPAVDQALYTLKSYVYDYVHELGLAQTEIKRLEAERDALRARLAYSQAQHGKTLTRLADQAENILAGDVNTVAATIDLQYVSAMLQRARTGDEHAQPCPRCGHVCTWDGFYNDAQGNPVWCLYCTPDEQPRGDDGERKDQ